MPLTETIAADKAVVRPGSYLHQIPKDPTEAEAALPVTATDYGRVPRVPHNFCCHVFT